MKTRNFAKLLTVALVLAILSSFTLSVAAQAQTPNIGVFDLQKALSDSSKGKAAKKKLESTFNKMKSDLQAKEKELDKLQKELQDQAKSKVLSQDALAQKAKTLQEKVRSYQEQLGKYNDEMRKAEENALKPLIDKAVKTAEDLGKKRGYIMVLETQQAGVLYYESSMDLTKEVTKALD